MHVRPRNLLTEAARCQRGATAILFAMVLPVLLLASGMAVDYGWSILLRNELQTAADEAALSAAKEYTVPGMPGTMQARLEAAANAQVALLAAKRPELSPTAVVTMPTSRSVQVNLSGSAGGFIMPAFGIVPSEISVSAAAAVTGATHICVLGLNETQVGIVALTLNAKLTAKGCAVYSNSTSSNGMYSMNNALLKADLICTAGGKTGGQGNYDPYVTVDCPKMPDPLAGRTPDPIGACNFTNLVVSNQTTTLSPGVYCGGLQLKGSSRVTLEPGVYVIKDGSFLVTDTAILQGQNVAFHLAGKKTMMTFTRDSTIDVTAPKTGPLAGILMFEDRTAHTLGLHTITSDNARVLLGTIYLPYSTFYVDSNNPVADKSAYTAIIADRVILNAGPSLVLNADYGATDIPVPEGIQKLGQAVRLTQ